jgi:hypothetical protein
LFSNSEERLDCVTQHTEGASIAALPMAAGEISQVQDRGGIRCVTAHGHPFDVWSLLTMKFIHLNGDTVTAMAAACALSIYKAGFYTDCKTEFKNMNDAQQTASLDGPCYKDDLGITLITTITTGLLHSHDMRPQCSHIHC